MSLTGVLAFTGEFDEADRLLASLEPSEELAPRVTFQRAATPGMSVTSTAPKRGTPRRSSSFARTGTAWVRPTPAMGSG